MRLRAGTDLRSDPGWVSLEGGREAVAHAERARDAYRESAAAHRNELADVEAWLRRHD